MKRVKANATAIPLVLNDLAWICWTDQSKDGLGSHHLASGMVLAIVSDLVVVMVRVKQVGIDSFAESNIRNATTQCQLLLEACEERKSSFGSEHKPFGVVISQPSRVQSMQEAVSDVRDMILGAQFGEGKMVIRHHDGWDGTVFVNVNTKPPQLWIDDYLVPDPYGRPHASLKPQDTHSEEASAEESEKEKTIEWGGKQEKTEGKGKGKQRA